MVNDYVKNRAPTGIFPFDYGTGGGFPIGRLSILYGPFGGAKTSTALRAMGMMQKKCSNCWNWIMHPITGEVFDCGCGEFRETICAWQNVEQSLDLDWSERMGLDMSRVAYSQPDYGKQAIDVTEALLESGKCHMVLLDSLAYLVPSKEIEISTEKGIMGNQPFLVARAIKKWLAAMGRCDAEHGFKPTMICTNQIRYKMTMFGDPETMSGGVSPGFMANMIVRVQSGKAKTEKGEELLGSNFQEMNFKVTKQKSGGPHREGSYYLVTKDDKEHNRSKGDVIDEHIVEEFAKKFNVLYQEGKKWMCLEREFRVIADWKEEMWKDRLYAWNVKQHLLQVMTAEEG